MKLLKRMICLLLTLCFLLGCLAGCTGTNNGPGGEEQTSNGPFRPDDPGVIAPLAENHAVPDDGVVWDMENIPDDLVATKWATANWASHDAFVKGNIGIEGVDGKGYKGSRALAVRQNGPYNWSDIYTIGMKKDETAYTNWSSGKILWIWYDSREIGTGMTMELELNGEHMGIGYPYFSMAEGEEIAQKAGTTPEAYTGAGYGRIPLKGSFVGWVGVPLEAFGSNAQKVKAFNLHISYNGQPQPGAALYLDNFCLSGEEEGPMGAGLSNVSAKLATSGKAAWNMENIPANLLSSGWASMDGAGWNGFVPNNIQVLGAAGCGVNGSRALQVRQVGAYNGADVFSINLTNDESAYTDWSEGEILWFWVNTRNLRDDLRLDLWIDGKRPAIGSPYYGINYSLQKQQVGTLPTAWDGADYGRITIGANYAGWVGIPLSAYGGQITDVVNVQMHLAYSGDNSKGRTVYFDEFWVTKLDEVPKTASGGSIAMLRGGLDGINPDVGPKLSLPAEVWSMEGLPNDPVSSDMIYAAYPTHAEYRAGNVSFARAAGKGYEGSNALKISQNGKYCGIDIFKIDLSRDSTAKRNWAGGSMLWLWMDTTEAGCGVKFDLSVDGQRPVVGASYFTVADGDATATSRTAPEAWEGGGYGRFVLTPGFKGWVGIPFSAYPNGLSSASLLELHLAYSGDPATGASVYMDSFWVRDDDECVNGVKINTPDDQDIKWSASAPVWDMEKLPANLQISGWASADYDYEQDYRQDNVQYLGAAGVGRSKSRALELRFNGSYSWADVFTLNLKSDATAATDWTGGGMLWFFVNAKDLGADAEMEIVLQGKKIKADSGYFTVQDGACIRKGELITAWDGYGRFPIESGYVGWIGLPLDGYADVSIVRNITMHVAGNGVTPGGSLYLDEFWVTDRDAVPTGAENGYIYSEGSGERDDLPLEVWSMEALPADPLSAGWVVATYASASDFVPDNVTVQAAGDKGHNGSRGLSFTQNGGYNWADCFTLMLSKDSTAITDWNGGDMIWFWVDASQFTCDITMDFKIDGRSPAVNEPYYTAQAGQTAELAGKLTRAWDGANYARVPIAAGYTGWIGLPFTSFNRSPVTAKSIEVHFGYSDNDAAKGKTLYIDALTLTDDATGPDGITILQKDPVDTRPATPDKAAWDMENIPDDLLTATWASARYGSHADYTPDNVQILGIDGKGRNNTRALAIRQNGGYCWADEFDIDLTMDNTFCNDWSSGDMLMLWVDATEFAGTQLTLELFINDNKPANDTSYFLEEDGRLVKAGTLPDAWGGSAGWGRLPVTSGFKGWIAVPLSAYGSVKTVETIKLHVGYYNNEQAKGHTLYLDDFWVLSGNTMPDGTATGSGSGETEITTVLNEGQQTTPESYLNTDASNFYQTVRAYGVSDCWWTNGIGTRSNIREIQELFFTDKGIALNNYRINVGGSVREDLSDGPTYESSWRAVLSPLDETGKMDLARNAGGWNALNALKALTDSGRAQIDDYTLFMNSPPSTMTDNGLTCSGKLRAECYGEYAKYVADVVQLYQLNGIPVRYVSPINEPTLAAWEGNTSQENCIYTLSEIVKVYEACIDELESRNLDVKLSIAEFSGWDAAYASLDTLLASEKIASHIDHYTAHDYSGSAGVKASTYQKASAAGLAMHMSEWCMNVNDKADNMDTALQLAEMLYTDMTSLNVETWSWWTGVGRGGYSDSLIYVSDNDSVYEVTKRFWAFGNYSKFTKGYTRTEVLEDHLPDGVFATAYTKDNGDGTASLVYVIGNKNDTDTPITLAGLPAEAKGRIYVTSDSYDCKQIGYLCADYGYSLPAKSVVTLVFDALDLGAIDSSAAPAVALPAQVADMEALAADLLESGGASSYFPANVGAGLAAGKGLNGSNALGYTYKSFDGGNYWGNSIRLNAAGIQLKTAWTGAEMLWFWVDTTEFQSQLNMDLWLNDGTQDYKAATGSSFYTWSGSGDPTEAGTIPEAWGGAGYGRVPLPKGYKGFIGIPMTAFAGMNTASVSEIYLYIEPGDDKDSLPKTLYIDELWITTADGTPDVTVQPEKLAGTVVWDMEQVTDVHAFSSTTWGGSVPLGTYIDGIVAEGKGVGGSKAIGYQYLAHDPNGDGANFLYISGSEAMAAQGFQKDWSSGKTVWLWVDATEFSHSVYMDFWLSWAKPATGAKFYLWDGTGEMTLGGTLPDAWGGSAGFGRIPIPQGYCGYIGLSLADFNVNTDSYNQSSINDILLYYETTDSLPKTLYIDNITLTDEVGSEPVTAMAEQVADMEALAADLFESGGASSYFPANVGAGLAAGKGLNGSNALGYTYKNFDGGNYWGNSIRLNAAGIQLKTVWTGAEMLWFWVDTTEFQSQLNMDLWLNDGTQDYKAATGSSFYTWSGSGDPAEAGTIPEAWSGAGYGRVPLPKGYKGFVGIPMTAFAGMNTASVSEIFLYMEPWNDSDSLPKTLYIDELWITSADGTPDVTVQPEKLVGTVVWDMEQVTDVRTFSYTTWGGSVPLGTYIDGIVAEGRGVGGSKAIGYQYLAHDPNGDGANFLNMENMGAAQGYNSDWSSGKTVWLWVDTTEFSKAVEMDLWLSWAKPAIGSQLYLWDGAGQPTKGGTLAEAWGGAGYGRIRIPQGYCGYIGLSLSDFSGLNTSNVNGIFLYYEPSEELPKTLYIDNITLTGEIS